MPHQRFLGAAFFYLKKVGCSAADHRGCALAQSCPMKSSALGSTFIVAGTALGAGMLAMPLATAGVGFFPALFMLGGLWAVMCYTALLLVEAYQQHAPSLGLASLAAHYLGPMGYWLATLVMPFLMYALVAAYIS